jgi:hypothetical protein
MSIPGNNDYSKIVDQWMRNDANTRFQYVLDREFLGKTYNLSLIKTLYPGVKVLTIVVNPWTRFYRDFLSLKVNSDLNLHTHMIYKSKNSKIKKTQYDLIFSNSLEHNLDFFFRSEHIEKDFQNFKSSLDNESNPIQFNKVALDHKNLFNAQSQEIIREIYQKDFEYFDYIDFL